MNQLLWQSVFRAAHLPVEETRKDERDGCRSSRAYEGQNYSNGEVRGLVRACAYSPIFKSSTKYAMRNPDTIIADVRALCLPKLMWVSTCSSSTASEVSSASDSSSPSSLCFVDCSPIWNSLSRQFRQGRTCSGYEKRTRMTIANRPTAIKSVVEGYMAMMLSPT
jgi:hypothetical protein